MTHLLVLREKTIPVGQLRCIETMEPDLSSEHRKYDLQSTELMSANLPVAVQGYWYDVAMVVLMSSAVFGESAPSPDSSKVAASEADRHCIVPSSLTHLLN